MGVNRKVKRNVESFWFSVEAVALLLATCGPFYSYISLQNRVLEEEDRSHSDLYFKEKKSGYKSSPNFILCYSNRDCLIWWLRKVTTWLLTNLRDCIHSSANASTDTVEIMTNHSLLRWCCMVFLSDFYENIFSRTIYVHCTSMQKL